jgi:hypothetical protein
MSTNQDEGRDEGELFDDGDSGDIDASDTASAEALGGQAGNELLAATIVEGGSLVMSKLLSVLADTTIPGAAFGKTSLRPGRQLLRRSPNAAAPASHGSLSDNLAGFLLAHVLCIMYFGQG